MGSLVKITVDEANKNYTSVDGNLYTKDGKTLIQYAVGKANTEFVIPDSVTSINSSAFSGCTSLTSIVIPDSVTSINSSAFYGCTSLTSIVIPDSVTSIGSSAFLYCSNLTSIVIPDGVTSIGDRVFYRCDVLTIYCEADSQPEGWNSNWNPYNRPVVWGYILPSIVLPGIVDFENYTDGAWTYDSAAPVIVNHNISGANAVGETKIVTEDGNKYISMVKSQGASSSAQTWFIAKMNTTLPEGTTTTMFQARIRLNFTSGSSAYVRFYKESTPVSGTNGKVFAGSGNAGRNFMFNLSGGVVKFDSVSLNAKSNEWFTLRLVLSGTTIQVWSEDAEGNMAHLGDVDRSAEWGDLDVATADTFVYMNDSNCCLIADFDDIYFGSVSQYEELLGTDE